MPKHSWYKRRSYPHFDWPMSYVQACKLVTDPHIVATHAFLPFISWNIDIQRYDVDNRRMRVKTRPIACASHSDAHIFAYYHSLLSKRYEEVIRNCGIHDSVLAYRRFEGGKCNIHFAKEAFQQIKARKNCSVIALDIEGFFDNLDHLLLKKSWSKLIGEERLPSDHYSVYKAITRYSIVNREELYKEFGIGRRRAKNYFGPICSPSQFRSIVRGNGLIKSHDCAKGIPQGSPISATLANIYLLEFDRIIVEASSAANAVYRRYSDDIILICCSEHAQYLENLIVTELSNVELVISQSKTARTIFSVDSTGNQTTEKPIQYLGFTFDGKQILIRSNAIAKYLRRVKSSIRSAKRAARKANSSKIHREKLYSNYSHLGNRNYISYVKRAYRVMESDSIKKQHKRHWNYLNSSILKAEKELELGE